MAGDVTSADAYSVGVGGIHRFEGGWYDLDASTGAGRGYGFASPVTELWVTARARSDIGVQYGIEVEIETRGDTTTVADEAFAFVEWWAYRSWTPFRNGLRLRLPRTSGKRASILPGA